MVRFAEAVPISADVNIFCVLLEFGKTLIYPFTQSLQSAFSFFLCLKPSYNPIRVNPRMDSFPKFLQLPNSDLFRNIEADS